MASTTSKIVFAIGITALVTAIVLIAGFAGFLYLREAREPIGTTSGTSEPVTAATPRTKGANAVAADKITRITYTESSMASRSSMSPSGYFSNINVQNYVSSSRTVTFSVDGTATRVTNKSGKTSGIDDDPTTEKFTASFEPDAFAKLARVFVENDFANEPDSRDITSLPIKKALTIAYEGMEKVINTGHLDRNSIEVTAMLKAFMDLEKAVAWKRIDQ